MRLLETIMIENNGNMISIPKGTVIREMNSQIGDYSIVMPVYEMVGTGAIAMIPNALGVPPKKKKKKKKVKEASNSQVSTLNLKY